VGGADAARVLFNVMLEAAGKSGSLPLVAWIRQANHGTFGGTQYVHEFRAVCKGAMTRGNTTPEN